MVTCEAVVPAPPEEVFRWFVEPELLVRWIGIDAQLEPPQRPGHLGMGGSRRSWVATASLSSAVSSTPVWSAVISRAAMAWAPNCGRRR